MKILAFSFFLKKVIVVVVENPYKLMLRVISNKSNWFINNLVIIVTEEKGMQYPEEQSGVKGLPTVVNK